MNATTAEELYSYYGMEYTSLYREEDLQIIHDYDYARKYANMFRYVAESEYDDTLLKARYAGYQEDLDAAETQLVNGYSLSLTSIYDAEARYREAAERLAEVPTEPQAIDTLKSYQLDVEDVPSYEDYVVAMSNKQLVDLVNDLGSAEELSVINGVHLVEDYDEKTVTYSVLDLSLVTSLFNGYVSAVTEDTVTVNHYNNIVSSYKGLTPCVQIGDSIGQGTLIGYSSPSVSVRLKINGVFVDVYKLLEEADEEF